MVRPKDYGDQFPSDDGDIVPSSPTAGMAEVDFSVQAVNQLHPTAPVPQITRATQFPTPANVPVAVQAGVITNTFVNGKDGNHPKTNPRRFLVQDTTGHQRIAYVPEMRSDEQYQIGDSVGLIRGANPQDWIIEGRGRQHESQIINCVTGAAQVFDEIAEMIPMAVNLLQVPIDAAFGPGKEFQLLADGQIQYTGTDQAIVTIAFGGSFQRQIEGHVHNLPVLTQCIEPGDWVANDIETHNDRIAFAKNIGFTLQLDHDTETATISIQADLTGGILNQQTIGEHPVWTTCPVLGGDISVGVSGDGWVKIGDEDRYAWLTHGDGQIKLRLPTDAPTKIGTVLAAVGITGQCVQLGFIEFDSIYNAPTFAAGTTPVSGYYMDGRYTPSNTPATCPTTSCEEYDPCLV